MSGKSHGHLFLEKIRENFVELPILSIFSLKKYHNMRIFFNILHCHNLSYNKRPI